ncbi:hypothetical protein GCM10011348_05070 [Marinobacterium nitratireducens]|uniref:Uncharacterized protein n=1 Tax=Marinobacterium nitratireducens TaxID=518897 RepID=A0A917Z9S0_9GAMM|nr:hypothetical protein GCM10011348_05070 [Marinobacterium nitratireducens]
MPAPVLWLCGARALLWEPRPAAKLFTALGCSRRGVPVQHKMGYAALHCVQIYRPLSRAAPPILLGFRLQPVDQPTGEDQLALAL